jgi:long-chain acyl-CoA synthetase
MDLKTENSVIGAFLNRAGELRGHDCVHYKVGGSWRRMSWDELSERALSMAVGLRRMGLKKGQCVATMVTTRLEWTIADLAIMAAGAINVPIYCTFTSDRIRTILRDSKSEMAVVEDRAVAELLKEANRQNGEPHELAVIGVEEGSAPVLVKELAEGACPGERRDMLRSTRGLARDDVASFVYTSGTTGELKGVVVTHGMILGEIEAAEAAFGLTPDDVALVCLPLAHVLGRLSQLYPLVHGTQSAYAESFDKLAANYMEVRPHYVCGVPRMLEKIHERVEAYLRNAAPRTRRLANWALSVGQERSHLIQKKRPIPFEVKLKFAIADKLVFRRLRARLGGRLKLFVCGGARLPEEVTRFFHAVGIMVLEGYGLTETFAAVTVNRFDDYHFGTVGKPLPGVSVKIASDGELLIKGPNVFSEYLNRPEETAQAFDAEGWFKSGDLGEYSRDGFLRITGRKKDMIVTAGGKNIAPQRIETIMSDSPFVSHFMVHGDGRKFLTALVTLNESEAREYLRSCGTEVGDGESLAANPAIRELIEAHVREGNEKLSKFETIKRFTILEGDFTVAGGELTPTLKVRRDFTGRKYREALDALYRD